MPMARLEKKLAADVRELGSSGRAKGAETVFTGILAPDGGKGPRYVLAGEGERPYLRMNSNSYPRFHGRQAAMIFRFPPTTRQPISTRRWACSPPSLKTK